MRNDRLDSSGVDPVHALVFHSVRGSDGYHTSTILTSHTIHTVEGRPLLGAGRAVGLTEQEKLRAILDNNLSSRCDYLPKNVIAISARQTVWYVPGSTRPMIFRVGSAIRRYTVPWPHLVLRVRGQKLDVVALGSGQRPGPSARLYHAPIANVHASSNVCTGSTMPPKESDLPTLPEWESILFDTAFTHPHHACLCIDGKATDSVARHIAFWKSLTQQKAERFPRAALVPMGLSVADWLRGGDQRTV